MLSKAPILQDPDFTKEFSVETDTSQVGLGAVLTQVYEIEGKQRSLPVAYASRSLKGAERKYSVTDQEALAVVWAVKTFNLYIMVTHFIFITNHNALKALTNKSVLEGRLARWADFLMGYDMNIVYRRGKDNIIANTLSRSMISQEWKEMDTAAKSNLITAQLLNRIYIPAERQEILLRVAHRTETGHLKFNKLLQFLKLRYFLFFMAKEVRICG